MHTVFISGILFWFNVIKLSYIKYLQKQKLNICSYVWRPNDGRLLQRVHELCLCKNPVLNKCWTHSKIWPVWTLYHKIFLSKKGRKRKKGNRSLQTPSHLEVVRKLLKALGPNKTHNKFIQELRHKAHSLFFVNKIQGVDFPSSSFSTTNQKQLSWSSFTKTHPGLTNHSFNARPLLWQIANITCLSSWAEKVEQPF